MLKVALEKLVEKQNLSKEESCLALRGILSDSNTYQSAAFLALMRTKGETVEELSGVIEAMENVMLSLPLEYPTLDIVGTGGDGARTVNISTGAAILAASCGVKIAKLGNRSSSSLCGSADVLEQLGIKIDQPFEEIKRSIEEIGIGFLFAPRFHPAMKKMKEIRSGLNIRTFFNTVGPLLNPVGSAFRMIGVADYKQLTVMASLVQAQNIEHAFVFHGCGLDELSTLGSSSVIEIKNGTVEHKIIDPQQLGLPRSELSDLQGGDAQINADILLSVFAGEKSAVADTLALNAAVALYLYRKVPSIEEGLELAQHHLNAMSALRLLQKWRTYG